MFSADRNIVLVLWMWAAAISVMIAFPPWVIDVNPEWYEQTPGRRWNLGYAFIATPPQMSRGSAQFQSSRIDYPRLALQTSPITLIGAGVVVTLLFASRAGQTLPSEEHREGDQG